MLRLPGGITLNQDDPIYATYNETKDKLIVSQEGPTDSDGYTVYKLQGMTFEVDKEKSFAIDFLLDIPYDTMAGDYELEAALTSANPTSLLISEAINQALPTGLTPQDFGLTDEDNFTYFKVNSLANVNFTVALRDQIDYRTAIVSTVAPEGSTDDLVAANFDEVVQVIFKLTNSGNTNYTGIQLYDILPYAGYLNSTGALEVVKIDIPPGSTIHYYIGNDPALLDTVTGKLPLDSLSGPDWSTDASAAKNAKAFYVDMQDFILCGGDSLEISIHFQIPDENAGDQIVYNQFAYAIHRQGDSGDLQHFASRPQGFTTKSYSIEYLANPSATGITGLPQPQSGVFLDPTENALIIASSMPQHNAYTALGWTDKAIGLTEGGTPKYFGGERYEFTENNPHLVLYPVWKEKARIPVTFDANYGWFSNGDASVSTTVYEGNLLEELTGQSLPHRTGYTFCYWYTLSGTEETRWDFDTHRVSGPSLKLYAKWKPLTQQDINISLVENLFDQSTSQFPLLDDLYNDFPLRLDYWVDESMEGRPTTTTSFSSKDLMDTHTNSITFNNLTRGAYRLRATEPMGEHYGIPEPLIFYIPNETPNQSVFWGITRKTNTVNFALQDSADQNRVLNGTMSIQAYHPDKPEVKHLLPLLKRTDGTSDWPAINGDTGLWSGLVYEISQANGDLNYPPLAGTYAVELSGNTLTEKTALSGASHTMVSGVPKIIFKNSFEQQYGKLTLSVNGTKIWRPHGNLNIAFTLRGTDAENKNQIFYTNVLLDNLQETPVGRVRYVSASGEITVENLPVGTYEIIPSLDARYVSLTNNDPALVTSASDETIPYELEVKNHRYLSHEDSKTISFILG